jgi:hypothetical protein
MDYGCRRARVSLTSIGAQNASAGFTEEAPTRTAADGSAIFSVAEDRGWDAWVGNR